VGKPLGKWMLGRWEKGWGNTSNIDKDHQEVQVETTGGCNWPRNISNEDMS
jgi:hypothetical protein